MTASEVGAAEREVRLGEAVFRSLQDLEAGQNLGSQELRERFPDCALELVKFFAGRAEFEQLAALLRAVAQATPAGGQPGDPTAEEGASAGPGKGSGGSFDFFFLAMAHWQLDDKDQARTWYDKAVPWMDKNKPQNEDLRRFRAEAEDLLCIKKTPKP
jgi:hypothetical protein